MYRKTLETSLVVTILSGSLAWQAAVADDNVQPRPVGTWALSLDAGPFGLPGFALTGIATFARDGTVIIVDAGDFGSLGTRDTAQLGSWEHTADGVVARTLMLSADPTTGEPLMWQRGTFTLHRGMDDDQMVGTITVEILPCTPIPPLPGALNCPNPVTESAAFALSPPLDIPIEFHRHKVFDD